MPTGQELTLAGASVNQGDQPAQRDHLVAHVGGIVRVGGDPEIGLQVLERLREAFQFNVEKAAVPDRRRQALHSEEVGCDIQIRILRMGDRQGRPSEINLVVGALDSFQQALIGASHNNNCEL